MSRPGPRIRRTVAATKRQSHAATIRTGKPTGSAGFGFKTCQAVSAAARQRAPSQAPQTVNTHRASIDRLTAMKVIGPDVGIQRVGSPPGRLEQDGPCGRLPGDNEVRSLTNVWRMCQSDSAEGFLTVRLPRPVGVTDDPLATTDRETD